MICTYDNVANTLPITGHTTQQKRRVLKIDEVVERRRPANERLECRPASQSLQPLAIKPISRRSWLIYAFWRDRINVNGHRSDRRKANTTWRTEEKEEKKEPSACDIWTSSRAPDVAIDRKQYVARRADELNSFLTTEDNVSIESTGVDDETTLTVAATVGILNLWTWVVFFWAANAVRAIIGRLPSSSSATKYPAYNNLCRVYPSIRFDRYRKSCNHPMLHLHPTETKISL